MVVMGCDIHLVAEFKYLESVGEWVVHPAIPLTTDEYGPVSVEVYLHRDYDLFAAMGHVPRSHVKVMPRYPLRGLPKDITEYSERAIGVEDNHSLSWLTFEEAHTAAISVGAVNFLQWITYAATCAPYVELKSQRVIFGFDN